MPPRPKVLVVEDDAALRKVLELRLVLEGFDVALAEDGQAGLEALSVVRPDVVITDLMMPRADGGAFCAGARTTPGFEGVPIILLTAHQRDAYVDDVLELGGIVFMAKPFDAPALVQTLRDLLVNARSAPQQELQAS